MHVVQYLMHHSTVMFDGTCVMLNKYIQCAVFIQFTMNLLWINYITLHRIFLMSKLIWMMFQNDACLAWLKYKKIKLAFVLLYALNNFYIFITLAHFTFPITCAWYTVSSKENFR